MKKATHKTDRNSLTDFEQIINIGSSFADDLRRLGFKNPVELIGKDPWKLYTRISAIDGEVHDPCVLDCYLAAVDYMNGSPPRKWWDYTTNRKKKYTKKIEQLRAERL